MYAFPHSFRQRIRLRLANWRSIQKKERKVKWHTHIHTKMQSKTMEMYLKFYNIWEKANSCKNWCVYDAFSPHARARAHHTHCRQYERGKRIANLYARDVYNYIQKGWKALSIVVVIVIITVIIQYCFERMKIKLDAGAYFFCSFFLLSPKHFAVYRSCGDFCAIVFSFGGLRVGGKSSDEKVASPLKMCEFFICFSI